MAESEIELVGASDYARGVADPHYRINLTGSEDFGVLSISLPFPKCISPEWGNAEWSHFLRDADAEIYSSLAEFLVQSVSLSYASRHRSDLISEADEVAIDYAGALFNSVLPLKWSGHKVGVYRRSNGWPVWTTICPTYEIALEEARELAKEAKTDSIKRVGKLSNPTLDRLGVLEYRSAAQSAAFRTVGLMALLLGVLLGAVLSFGISHLL